jgi:plastocyanin
MKKALIFALLLGASLPFFVLHSYGQNTTESKFHKDVDSSPIEAVIIINDDQNKIAFFQPDSIAVRVGGEILIANNSTSDHSVISGSGPDDPMSGKFFNTDIIKPRGFVEYAAENLVPGNYSFYSATDPKIKGQLEVIP